MTDWRLAPLRRLAAVEWAGLHEDGARRGEDVIATLHVLRALRRDGLVEVIGVRLRQVRLTEEGRALVGDMP